MPTTTAHSSAALPLPANVPPDLAGRLAAAVAIACEVGDYIQSQVGQVVSVESKSSVVDLVTNVDKEADKRIGTYLRNQFPDDTLITEETFQEGVTALSTERAWVVDPIDGTTSFAHGFPYYSVSIAWLDEGVAKLGVVYDPCRNECFYAVRGSGAWLNGQPLCVTKTTTLQASLWATGFPYSTDTATFEEQMQVVKTVLQHTHGIRRLGSAALDLVYVACGRLDGFWEYTLSPWDIAAGALIVEEAGGQTSNLDGVALRLDDRLITILASNGLLHQPFITLYHNGLA
ncbi:MAG: inositol monophosphatase family protein [Vampirovibrionales bacterium]|nr:inositol monophosphatase [Cyanobacteria bacterium HKST-UBA03]